VWEAPVLTECLLLGLPCTLTDVRSPTGRRIRAPRTASLW
jgi:hypothetical protein